jgi:hypothetical protein
MLNIRRRWFVFPGVPPTPTERGKTLTRKHNKQDDQRQRPRTKGLNDDKPVWQAQYVQNDQDTPSGLPHKFRSSIADQSFPSVDRCWPASQGRSKSHVARLLTSAPGFLTKIKKLLETVCHNCGKIKARSRMRRASRNLGSDWFYVSKYAVIDLPSHKG